MISKILKNVRLFLQVFCILISFAFIPFQVPEGGQTYQHVPNQLDFLPVVVFGCLFVVLVCFLFGFGLLGWFGFVLVLVFCFG